jgi:hypothetical protein
MYVTATEGGVRIGRSANSTATGTP